MAKGISSRPIIVLAFLFLYCVLSTSAAVEEREPDVVISSHQFNDESHKVVTNQTHRYKLVSFKFDHVEVPYVICLWILLACIAKIGFHLYDKLPHVFPESCLLITLGILVGVTLYFTETASSGQYTLNANTFFLFLLPPIIYDAGYHMPNRAFFNNIGTILLLAVVNTLWNTMGIGICLYGMSELGWIHSKISLLHCFVFSSLISAVDPVAVLAIFEEIQVNEILYIIVFGESLLNDGVTVVLYHMMDGFTEIGEANLQIVDFVTGFAQFFIVVCGGTLIGVVYGLVGAFITKYTDHVRVLEPLFVFVLGYLAYLTAESMELSGILALTFGGIVMRHYSELNMAKKSTTTVKYFMKMLANISETIIFMFLGLSTVIDSHDFRLDFVLFSLLFCLVFRVTGVMMLSWLVNQRRLIRLTAIDQFIMSYGGLRGGIAFCLALLLNAEHIPERQMFVTTTTVIVFFTVFVQGITIKPVVNALKVERAEEIDTSMNEMIHKRFIDHLMAGVEDIIGKSGHNSIFQRFDYYNDKFLKPWLLREKPRSRDTKILRTYTRLNMQDAKAVAKAFPVSIPRELSFSSLNGSPSTLNLQNMGRRATIAVPSNRDFETVVNVSSLDPTVQKNMNDESSVLQDALLEPRPGYVNERRHTLAEIHNRQTPFVAGDADQLRNLISDIHRGAGLGSNNNNTIGHVTGYTNDGASCRSNPESPSLSGNKSAYRRLNKNVSFSNSHGRLTKKLSDVAELHPDGVHEVCLVPGETGEECEVTFTVGQPAPDKKSGDKGVVKEKTVKDSLAQNQTPEASRKPATGPSTDTMAADRNDRNDACNQASDSLTISANTESSPQDPCVSTLDLSIEQSSVADPSIEQSSVGLPDPSIDAIEQSSVADHSIEQSSVPDPSIEQSSVGLPDPSIDAIEQSSVPDTSIEQSPVPDPSIEQSPVPDPSIEQSPVADPSIEQSSVEDHSIEQSPVPDPSIEQSSVADHSIEQSSVPDPSIEQSSVGLPDPSIEQSSVGLPDPSIDAIEQSSVPDTSIEQSPVPDPSIEQSSVPDTSIEQSPVPDPSIEQSSVGLPDPSIDAIEQSSVPDTSIEQSPVPDPSIEQSPVADPSIEQSSVADHSIEQSPVPDPSIEQSSVADHSIEQSSVPDPSIEQSSVGLPDPSIDAIEQSSVPDTSIEQSPVPDPSIEQSPVPDPSIEQSSVGLPDPSIDAIEQSSVPDTSIEQSPVPDPSIEQSPVPDPSIEQSSVADPSIEQSSVADHSIEQSPVPDPSIEQSSVADHSLEQSSVADHSIEQSSVADPSIEQSSVPDPFIEQSSVADHSIEQSSVPNLSIEQSSVGLPDPSIDSIVQSSVPDTSIEQPSVPDLCVSNVTNPKPMECSDCKCATLAETSLPWRRPTSLSPVPSALCQSVPDEEHPLQYHAPAWADNPAYHRLTESGSPYQSPNTTITAAPQEEPPRPVFDIFLPLHQTDENNVIPHVEPESSSFIPPLPWSHAANEPVGELAVPALPSQFGTGRDTGDKAACMLVSSHDLVPPTHHPCLQPAGPSTASLSSSHKHSEASSPLHFQCREKPEAVSSASIEAHVIGLQADYHHSMKERVSQWLASSPHQEEGNILASLRDKQEKWALEHETDEGTDADVESEDEDTLDIR